MLAHQPTCMLSPAAGAYTAWGTTTFQRDVFGTAPQPRQEPNNLLPPELCTVANGSALQGSPAVWGWADVRCIAKRQSLCRLLGKS
jgi:hypothetical protein